MENIFEVNMNFIKATWISLRTIRLVSDISQCLEHLCYDQLSKKEEEKEQCHSKDWDNIFDGGDMVAKMKKKRIAFITVQNCVKLCEKYMLQENLLDLKQTKILCVCAMCIIQRALWCLSKLQC